MQVVLPEVNLPVTPATVKMISNTVCLKNQLHEYLIGKCKITKEDFSILETHQNRIVEICCAGNVYIGVNSPDEESIVDLLLKYKTGQLQNLVVNALNRPIDENSPIDEKRHLDTFFHKYQVPGLKLQVDCNSCFGSSIRTWPIACLQSSLSAVKSLVASNVDMYEVDNVGRSALHWACAYSSLEIVDYIIQHGADINVRDHNGQTVLMSACQDKCVEKVLYLLRCGLSIRNKDFRGATAMHFAAALSSIEVVELVSLPYANSHSANQITLNDIFFKHYKMNIPLMKLISDNQHNQFDITPLHAACAFNSLDVVQHLMKHTKDIDFESLVLMSCLDTNLVKTKFLGNYVVHHPCTMHQQSPIDFASELSSTSMIKWLIKIGNFFYNPFGEWSNYYLSLACRDKDLEKVQYFLSLGFEVNRKDVQGKCPLHYAAEYSISSVLNLLVQHGASLEETDNENETILLSACKSKYMSNILFCIKHGLDTNRPSFFGDTPLHVCAESGTASGMTCLLEGGADINTIGYRGRTILHAACMDTSLEKVKICIAKGLEVNKVEKDGNTPLHYVAKYGNVRIMEYLCEIGANVNAINKNGESTLHLACMNKSLSMIKMCVRRAVDVNTYGIFAKHSIDICVQQRFHLAIAYLLFISEIKLSNNTLVEAFKVLSNVQQQDFAPNICAVLFSLLVSGSSSLSSDETFTEICDLSFSVFSLFFSANPILPLNSYERYVKLGNKSTKSFNIEDLSRLKDEFPTLKRLCRARIRCYLYEIRNQCSILPRVVILYNQRLLPLYLAKYLYMHDECPIKTTNFKISAFTSSQVRQPTEYRQVRQGDHKLISLKVFENMFSKTFLPQTANWILSEMGCSCPAEPFCDGAPDDFVTLDQLLHVVRVETDCGRSLIYSTLSRLLDTFLHILSIGNSLTWYLWPSGSYKHDTKVGLFDEIDFVAVLGKLSFEMIDKCTPILHRVRISSNILHNIMQPVKNYLYEGLHWYLKNEMILSPDDRYKVHVKSCNPDTFSPAVCTVFEWSCQMNHTHEISVDLTPAIPFRKLKEVHSTIPVLNKEPFVFIKDQLLDTEVHLVPRRDPHHDIQDNFISSLWQVSYFATTEIIWELLDKISSNIKRAYRLLKHIRDTMFPHVLKYSTTKGFDESQLVSSYTLYGVLLNEVTLYPTSEFWTMDNYDRRIISMLEYLSRGEYTGFFDGKPVSCLKFQALGSNQRDVLTSAIKQDINDLISFLNGDVDVVKETLSLNDSDATEFLDNICIMSTVYIQSQLHIRFMVTSLIQLAEHGTEIRKQLAVQTADDLYYYKLRHVSANQMSRFMQNIIIRKFIDAQ